MSASHIEERSAWRHWATPKILRNKPVHRWCVFPHSFSSELVHGLIDEWQLSRSDRILDPFCGAGTTLLAAKERGIPATGYDLSPFAAFTSRVKSKNYSSATLRALWDIFRPSISTSNWNGASRDYPQLVRDALPGRLLGAFDAMRNEIDHLNCANKDREFFKLALLMTMPDFSRVIPTGGWLKWTNRRRSFLHIPAFFAKRIEMMISDTENDTNDHIACRVGCADARTLPETQSLFSAVITSPPYPNRHDYTRVFGVELMFGFLDWSATRQLRYQSFQSHPESHPLRPPLTDYVEPSVLTHSLTTIANTRCDPRIIRLLRGYFQDMFLCLKEIKRVCQNNAHVALVLGNAQYSGVPFYVDELTSQIGTQVGLEFQKLIVVRHRGNSAQQMGVFGRHPSRESIVVFRVRHPESRHDGTSASKS